MSKTAKEPQLRAIVVEVIDPAGKPLVNAEVEGLVDVNPGPVASTCCITKHFASAKTSAEGRATLDGAPYTFRAFHFRASFQGWPRRETTASLSLGQPNVVRIQLGPARAVRGRVDLGPDCPLPSDLDVRASASTASARVAADGSFFFKSLPPWSTLSINACGRSATAALEIGDDRPVLLTLPGAQSP
ncbi:MAG TPA: carboxypeptidase-like regulatory domain-containing protein [Polyangiaceae bacterium]|nr:carboxypeptidase-like regulatory domain-containing protein [Polyangiaceae bacterium]